MSALEIARKKVSFDVQKMSYVVWESEERFNRFQAFQKLLANDPLLKNDPRDYAIGRAATYELYAKKAKKLLETAEFKDIKDFATLIYPEALVSSLNFEMFLPTILNVGTPEQNKLFYEPAARYEILGCYAQTELAHGSDMNRIETTATYDKSTKEFVIHTPSLKATKWWGSDLGLTSTHAVTQAVLIVDGKKHGVQNFIVPIRDVKTHLPLPGIQVGDIGAKFGYNSKDNGFLRFDNVRIPKVNMLSKYINLTDDGVFSKTGDDKIWHATMQLQRQHFLESVWKCLGQGLTIAIRYGLQRTQFKDKSGKEVTIFDYQLQQQKLIPLIAEMYGNMFGARRVLQMCQDSINRIRTNSDTSKMTEVHVALAASKAFYTWNCFFALEKVRQTLGGHGYSYYSGIPVLITEMSPCVTAEGDNTVLSLSVGKLMLMYLNKSMQTGKAPNSTCDYIEDIFNYLTEVKVPIQTQTDVNDILKLKEALRYNVAFNLASAGQKLQDFMGEKGLSFKEATDKHLGILLNEITHTHSNYWTLKVFLEEISKIKDVNLNKVLTKLAFLYAYNKIQEQQTQLFEYGVLGSQAFIWVREARDSLIASLKDDSLGLVEALGYDNNALRSAIGQKEGKIYETLLHWAKDLNPVNDPQFNQEVFEQIKSIRAQSPMAKL